MCGLVGLAGKLEFRSNDIFRDMLDVCQLRGRDSTGVIRVNKQLQYDYVKRVGTPTMLVDSREYETKVEKTVNSILIGHCRAKTVGDVSVKNAHPFDFPEHGIIGVHNGTLRNHSTLEGHTHNKVDSEILYNHIAVHGALDALGRVEGAYACVWWDNNEKTLNFARNSERTLFLTSNKTLDIMFWASEPWMFGAVERKIPLIETTKTTPRFELLPEKEIWSYRIDPNAKQGEDSVILHGITEIKDIKKVYTPYTQWKKKGEGAWEKTGGEVVDPFRLSPQEEMEDPLPEEISSPLSSLKFLNTSVSRKNTLRNSPQSSTKNSQKPTLSLVVSNSTDTPKTSKNEPSNVSKDSGLTSNSGVSHRSVLGIPYVTKNSTKEEFPWAEIRNKTNGKCSYCNKECTPFDIGELFSASKFVCTPCLFEPTEINYLTVRN